MSTIHLVLLICFIYVSHVAEGFNVGVQGTSCSSSNDPCGSLYNAECDGKHCRCPLGTTEDKALKRCKKSSNSGSSSRGGKGSGGLSDLPFDYVPGKKPEPRTPKTNGSPIPTRRPATPGPRQPNVSPPHPSGRSKDTHLGEKAGGGLGGAIGLVVLGAVLYFCCRGGRGQGLKDKLPFFKSSGSVGGGPAGTNYQMQQV